MKNPFAVDIGFVVSLAALRDVCKALCDGEKRWWVDGYNLNLATLCYNNPTGDLPNEISFHFPIVAKLALLGEDEGTMVCLYPPAAQARQTGLYFEGSKLCHDAMADWESFWFPLEAKLWSYRNTEIQTTTVKLQGDHDQN